MVLLVLGEYFLYVGRGPGGVAMNIVSGLFTILAAEVLCTPVFAWSWLVIRRTGTDVPSAALAQLSSLVALIGGVAIIFVNESSTSILGLPAFSFLAMTLGAFAPASMHWMEARGFRFLPRPLHEFWGSG